MAAQERESARIYIIGAGFAGRTIAKEIAAKRVFGSVVAFLDDDPGKIGSRIEGIPVLGPIRDVVNLLSRQPADEAIIAIPSASREALRELYFLLKKAGFARIRIVPTIAQIIEGDAHLIQAREIDPQDLLGRNPVTIGLRESLLYLRGKRVLITGAGGSIGSELARQLLSAGVARLYLYGHGENSIYNIDRDLRLLQEEGVGEKTSIVPVIGELKDADYVRFVLTRLKCDAIFHAAAYKHVPMMEANPVAAVENNVLGTRNLVEAALGAGVRRFVLISTDKAVEPVSTYGASKLIAERIVLSAAARASAGREFMVVRFGNVLGSRGSIVPLFQKQIAKGGPVTVTHPDATRYFMTIPEACSLVLKTGGVGKGGKLYLLDMGEAVKIRDLAEQMIRFYGYEPGVDIRVDYIGLRPGERVEEHLWAPDEELVPTEYPRINRLERAESPFDLEGLLSEIDPVIRLARGRESSYRNRHVLRAILKKHVPTLIVPEHEPEY
ncbi:MAG TPA: nucleoside-diphosphate sugar epimerase/dehydratase [Rectinemataceae bacterium]|nr:nucleoside-diphosphate sugar epimerase/dehydratase [Rectinemataceae bacterium]